MLDTDFTKTYIKSLYLSSYRNLKNEAIHFSDGPNIILGKNGTGKTNILESISLLSPGKGFRKCNFDEFVPSSNISKWHCKYELHSYMGKILLDQYFDISNPKRYISLNEQKISQNELNNFTNIFWITPQQNVIFNDNSQERRKFFDRIILNFDSAHSSRVARYEYYQKERMKILLHENLDKSWLEIVEKKLSQYGVELALIRNKILNELQQEVDILNSPFPMIQLKLKSEIDDFIINSKISDIKLFEESLIEFSLYNLKYNRTIDREKSKTAFGPHKTDFFAIQTDKNIHAKYCSTGEQQSILITILFAVINLFNKKFNKKPIILLDEIFTHLDFQRREALSEFLIMMKLQSIVTSTEDEFCPKYFKNANLFSTDSITK